jgi:hypothetical protein
VIVRSRSVRLARVDFYGTTAQVIPVLLLALMWDSGYMERLARDERGTVRFWTKPKVRIWGLIMATTAMAGEAAVLLVLADIVPAGDIPKWVALVGLAALVGSMVVRLFADVIVATGAPPALRVCVCDRKCPITPEPDAAPPPTVNP